MTIAGTRLKYGAAGLLIIGVVTATFAATNEESVTVTLLMRIAGLVTLFAVMLAWLWSVVGEFRAAHPTAVNGCYGVGVGCCVTYLPFVTGNAPLVEPGRALLQILSFGLLFVLINRPRSKSDRTRPVSR